VTVALAALLAAGCATTGSVGMGSAGSSRSARAGFEAWLERGDVAGAERILRAAAEEDPGDPWVRTGLALLARRSLDSAAELEQLLAVVRAAPDRALAVVALDRLSELALVGPDVDRAIEAGLASLASEGRLRGVAAFRARVARIAAAECAGDADGLARLRREYGVATEWTVVGPFSPLPALDFDAELPSDRGLLPAEAPVLPGALPSPARRIPVPDGVLALGGEAGEGGLHLLASDVRLARGGRYLLMLWTHGSARVQVDGAPVAEQEAHPVRGGRGNGGALVVADARHHAARRKADELPRAKADEVLGRPQGHELAGQGPALCQDEYPLVADAGFQPGLAGRGGRLGCGRLRARDLRCDQ